MPEVTVRTMGKAQKWPGRFGKSELVGELRSGMKSRRILPLASQNQVPHQALTRRQEMKSGKNWWLRPGLPGFLAPDQQ